MILPHQLPKARLAKFHYQKYIIMNKSVGKPKLGLLKNGQPYIMEDESF